ncbi:MAG: serine hydrolase domain-containing protein [Acidimicrobiia bacterium]
MGACLLISTMILVGCSSAEERFLEDRLGQIGDPRPGTMLLALGGADGSIDAVDKGDAPLGPDDPIRIASITKAFTSALALTLVMDGVINLDASASAYVPRLSLPGDVTVRHLLNQRSGLADYTQQAIYGNTQDGNSTVWTPNELYQLIQNEGLRFRPGSRFEYANTNHMILGLLIEEGTGQPYHQALRERILDPLGLDATYLSHYEQGETPRDSYTEQLGGPAQPVVPVDFDYTAIATTVWSAGGLVSNAVDVHNFFTALSKGDIIPPSMFSEMITGTGIDSRRDPARRYDYGLGVELFEAPEPVYGARGNLPGYITLVMHAPETLKTFMYVTTNDQYHNVSWIVDDAADLVSD